jgi:hypothetical protein
VDLGTDNLTVEGAIYFTEALTNIAVTRSNLGLGWSALTNTNGASSLLGINSINRVVHPNGSGNILFTNSVQFLDGFISVGTTILNSPLILGSGSGLEFALTGTNQPAKDVTLRNLGLGATNSVAFGAITVNDGSGNHELRITEGGFVAVEGTNELGSLELETRAFTGGVFTFEQGLHSRGNIVITNQSATNNGILFIYRTNNEPFLGLANLIASNNTTISNETLFRVGTAEATNRSAQFGFRSTNTNGSGVAVFSVFGYNALMQIGVDASTNAVIFSGGGTNNEVMTLIKSGATEFARPISFSTTAHAAATRTNLALGATSDPTFRDVSVRDLSIVGGSGGKIIYPQTNTAPANTTNVVTWIQVNVGTNSYRVPLYQ